MSQKPSLLFVATQLSAIGGANTVISWSLQALKDEWDITILCADYPDFEGVDRHYGTSLLGSEFHYIRIPWLFRILARVDPDPFSIQRAVGAMLTCQKISDRYDAVYCGQDEFDLGRPGVLYTHYPYLERHKDALERVDSMSRTRRFRDMLVGKVRPWLVLTGLRISELRKNHFLTNSRWTANAIKDVYGVDAEVIYPPVKWSAPEIPWNEKRFGFVSVGRIDPGKRLPEQIAILSEVRKRGFDIEYDIIGDRDKVAGQKYLDKIRNLATEAGPWIRINQSVPRERLEEIVSTSRFGLHALRNEHFGIGVAEMVRGGCITFVHNSGGQVEIVGDHPLLRYSSEEDAVDKICEVLASDQIQQEIHHSLALQANRFTSEVFMNEIRSVMRRQLDSKIT